MPLVNRRFVDAFCLVLVFERSSSPRRHSRHSYEAALLPLASGNAPAVTELRRCTDADTLGTYPTI